VAAGLATLRRLEKENPYPRLEELGSQLEKGLLQAAAASGVPVRINRIGSMFTVFFTAAEVTNFDSAKGCDTDRFKRFFHGMLSQGIYLPPSQFEAAFISAAHTKTEVEETIGAAKKAFTA